MSHTHTHTLGGDLQNKSKAKHSRAQKSQGQDVNLLVLAVLPFVCRSWLCSCCSCWWPAVWASRPVDQVPLAPCLPLQDLSWTCSTHVQAWAPGAKAPSHPPAGEGVRRRANRERPLVCTQGSKFITSQLAPIARPEESRPGLAEDRRKEDQGEASAPTCRGIKKLEKVPDNPAVSTKNTMIVPCIVTRAK